MISVPTTFSTASAGIRRTLMAVALLALGLVAGACSGAKSIYNMPPGVDPKARLDSLAAISQGDYVHVQISPCRGSCDGYVSIYRTSPASFHIYEAEAWGYNEFERGEILHRVRVPLSSDVADEIIARIDSAGLMLLTDDSTRVTDNSGYMWVRARVGQKTLALDHVYLGSRSYGSTAGPLAVVYTRIREALFADLFRIRIPRAEERR
jgi:hypothetical protein